MVSQQTLSLMVEDRPGVLARVASLLYRFNANIETLQVQTSSESTAKIDMTLDIDPKAVEVACMKLHKLVNVIEVTHRRSCETSVAPWWESLT
ncbi:MAG: ACT domain-containing protein [Acidimicrobiia bacterium]